MELDLQPEVQAHAMGEAADVETTAVAKLERAREPVGRRDLANLFFLVFFLILHVPRSPNLFDF